MGERIFELLRLHFQHHGYLTVAGTLLLENAGLPLPGETVLLFASFLAHTTRQLHLGWLVFLGTMACTCGDNLGYLIGHQGGRRLLERWKYLFRVRQAHIERGERLFQRYGPAAIFFARFIFGMRMVAGPLAGVLRMPWKSFALFNFLGAATWVTTISLVGYLSGRHWHALLRLMRGGDLILFGLLLLAGVLLWRRHQRQAHPLRSSPPKPAGRK